MERNLCFEEFLVESVGRLLIIVEIFYLNGAFAWVCSLSCPHGGAIVPLFNPRFYLFILLTDYLHICFGFVFKYKILNSIKIRYMGH